MKRHVSGIIAAVLAFCVVFSGMPLLTGSLDVHAASAAKKKITLKAAVAEKTSVKLKWNKIKKPDKGYAVFRDGKVIKRLNTKKTSFTDKGLEPGSEYKYQIKTYTKKKVKKWYNKKTGKWQKKKPAKKYRGKSKKVTVYTYKKKSNAVTVRISPAPSGADDSNDNSNSDGNSDGNNHSADNNTSDEENVLTVTWKNWDGTVLYSCTAKPNEVPEYEGKDPIRPDEGKICYKFSKWDNGPSEARYVQTYTAEYEMQLKPSGYTYDIKILNKPYYSRYSNSGTIAIYLDTDNPDPGDITYTAFDSNGEPLRTLWEPGVHGGEIYYSVSANGSEYADVDTLDRGYITLFDLYIVQNNEFALTDKITFKFYEEDRGSGLEREVASKTVRVYDFDAAEKVWTDAVLAEVTTPSMTNKEKMYAICRYILDNFTYTLNDKGYGNKGYLYLITDVGKPYWERGTLNSYSSPGLLCWFGKLLDYPLKNMYPVYEQGTPEWDQFHMFAYSEQDDAWFEACPYTETGTVDPSTIKKWDPDTYQFWEE